MKNKLIIGIAGIFLSLLSFNSCSDSEAAAPELTIGNIVDTIPQAGGTKTLNFSCNSSWSIDTTGFSWLHVMSPISGDGGNVSLQYSAGSNLTGASRSLILVINASNGQRRRITVLQAPNIFPSYNTSPLAPDATGMGSTAMQLNANIKMGINLWNTFEAPYDLIHQSWETGWGQPVVTQSLIDLIKQSGFNAIRIPCGYWAQGHMDKKTGKIDDAWLNRIKEVVQYCVNDGMYVEINRHHDGNDDFHLTGAQLDSAKAIHKAVWEQVATAMRDFDEHVMFASLNEPQADDFASYTVLHDFHQIFIDAVRSTGGKNTYRTLVLQAPNTSLDLANYFAPGNIPGWPVDPTPNKLMLEIHYYTPSNFCILQGGDASWGKEWRYWGANFHSTDDLEHNSEAKNEEGAVLTNMQIAKKNYVDKGIPVFIGEYGASNHAAAYSAWENNVLVYHPQLIGNPTDSILSLNSQAHFYRVVTQRARENGISTFLWAGVFDRHAESVNSQRELDSVRVGSGY